MNRLGWVSVYAYTERKGHAVRYRWRACGADGLVLARGQDSFPTEAAAYRAVARVSGLLASVCVLKRQRAT